MNLGFHLCIRDWCLQSCTKEQYTRCKAASEDGRTCYNPTIRYGSSTWDGHPAKHKLNDIAGWCQQLFPTSLYGGTATYIKERYYKPGLFWCSLYDEISPHWCDCQDGKWKDSTIDGTIHLGSCGYYRGYGMLMDSVTCQIP